MMLARAINEEEQEQSREESEIEDEEEEGHSESAEQKRTKKLRVSREQIREIVNMINSFMVKKMPKYRQEY